MEWELGVSRCKLLYVEYMKNQVLLYIAQETIFNIQCVCLVVQLCLTLCDPMDYNASGSSVHGFPRQEHWGGLPFPFPGDLPNPGIEPGSLALQADSLPSESRGKPDM